MASPIFTNSSYTEFRVDEVKRDDWVKDVWPSMVDNFLDSDLSPREIPIVIAASNDALLEHLLNKRLADPDLARNLYKPHQALGDSSNRREIAYQIGLISKPSRVWMQSVSELRNMFAHHVNASYQHPKAQALFRDLRSSGAEILSECFRRSPELLEGVARELESYDAADTKSYTKMLMDIHWLTQILFHYLSESIDPLSFSYENHPEPPEIMNQFLGLFMAAYFGKKEVRAKIGEALGSLKFRAALKMMVEAGELSSTEDKKLTLDSATVQTIWERSKDLDLNAKLTFSFQGTEPEESPPTPTIDSSD